jgi:hypothetical protein
MHTALSHGRLLSTKPDTYKPGIKPERPDVSWPWEYEYSAGGYHRYCAQDHSAAGTCAALITTWEIRVAVTRLVITSHTDRCLRRPGAKLMAPAPSDGCAAADDELLVWSQGAGELSWIEMAPTALASSLPVLILTGRGHAVAVNQPWAALSSAPAEASLSLGWLRFICERDREPAQVTLDEASRSRTAGTAIWRLGTERTPTRTRWWWRPGPAGWLVVFVQDMGHCHRTPADVP